MIENDFTFGQELDQNNFLQGFKYIADFNLFKWDSEATAKFIKLALLQTNCLIDGCTGESFKINESEKEAYCVNHWNTSLRNLNGVFISVDEIYEDFEGIFRTLDKELIYLQERYFFVNRVKDHIKSYKDSKEIIDQNINQINIQINKLTNLIKNTPCEQLRILSYARNICKDIQYDIISAINYINSILLDFNIELTYKTLISSQKIDESLSEEEEKIPHSFPLHSSVIGKSITIPFITNLSNFRLNNLSYKVSSILSQLDSNYRKITDYNRVLMLIGNLLENIEEKKGEFEQYITNFMYQLKDVACYDKIMSIISKNNLIPSKQMIKEFISSEVAKKIRMPEFNILKEKIGITEEKYKIIKKKLKSMKKSKLLIANDIEISEYCDKNSKISWLYTGQCREDTNIKEGLGTLICSDGSFYQCYWANDLPCYQGLLITSDKKTYEGVFKVKKDLNFHGIKNQLSNNKIMIGVIGASCSGNSWLIERYETKDVPKKNIATIGVETTKIVSVNDEGDEFNLLIYE